MKKHWFTFAIILIIILSILLSPMLRDFDTSLIVTIFIIGLFLISGLLLPSETILFGLKQIKAHLFIQIFIFVITPLVVFITVQPFKNIIEPNLLIGIYSLSCLPTTVSSCIIFTQISRGNVVLSIFNSSLANILGIFISPALLSFMLQGISFQISNDDIIKVIISLSLKMFFPLIAGQIIRRLLKEWVFSNRKKSF